ncbi:MAG: SRPBCC family protein [Microcystaceae cyanobacterium]
MLSFLKPYQKLRIGILLFVLIAVSYPILPSFSSVPLTQSQRLLLKKGEVLITGQSGIYRGQVLVNSSPETIWAVLTDYDNFEQFLPYVQESKIIVDQGSNKVFEQITGLDLLLLNQTSVSQISVQETPIKRIEFTGIQGDWQSLKGEWLIIPLSSEPSSSQFLIIHQVTIEPSSRWNRSLFFSIYPALLEETLKGIQQEVLRRSQSSRMDNNFSVKE